MLAGTGLLLNQVATRTLQTSCQKTSSMAARTVRINLLQIAVANSLCNQRSAQPNSRMSRTLFERLRQGIWPMTVRTRGDSAQTGWLQHCDSGSLRSAKQCKSAMRVQSSSFKALYQQLNGARIANRGRRKSKTHCMEIRSSTVSERISRSEAKLHAGNNTNLRSQHIRGSDLNKNRLGTRLGELPYHWGGNYQYPMC